MARTWYFSQTHPGTSSRALTGTGDNASHYPHLPQQEAFFPPHRWFRNLDDVHKHRNDRVSVSFRNSGHPSFDVCVRDNKPRSPADTCIVTHGCMAHKHNRWQTPIDRSWFFLGGTDVKCDPLACLITLCKYCVCRAIVHMFTGISLLLCSICPLESSYYHSWT